MVTVALTKIVADVLAANGLPGAIASTCVGGTDVGEWMTNDPRFPLISFTGSTKVGRIVSETVHRRFGRTILELGGNNATIGMCLCVAVVCSLLSAHRVFTAAAVASDADVDMAVRACVFGAVGTAGQRCTTLRRLVRGTGARSRGWLGCLPCLR